MQITSTETSTPTPKREGKSKKKKNGGGYSIKPDQKSDATLFPAVAIQSKSKKKICDAEAEEQALLTASTLAKILPIIVKIPKLPLIVIS